MANTSDFLNNTATNLNLMVNAARLRQLQEANAALSTLVMAENQREQRADAENKLRQFVFATESMVQDAARVAVLQPKQALFTALSARYYFGEFGVDPSRFTNFTDKDRTRSVIQQIDELDRCAQSALTAAQIAQVRSALTLATTRSDLERLIEGVRCEEALAPLAASYRGHWWANLLGQLFALALGFGAFILFVYTPEMKANTAGWLSLVFSVAAFAFAVYWLFRCWIRRVGLLEKRTAAEKACLPAREMARLRALFPTRSSSAGYQALLGERDAEEMRLLA